VHCLFLSFFPPLTTPQGGKSGDKPVSQAAIRTNLRLSKSQTSYRANRLLKMGYLSNLENQGGKPHKLVPGAPLPEEVPPLPSPCELSTHLLGRGRLDLVGPWVDPVSGAVHNCWDHIDANSVEFPEGLRRPRTPEPCVFCIPDTLGSATNRTGRTDAHNSCPSKETVPGVRFKAEPLAAGLESSADKTSSAVRVEEGEDEGRV